MTINNIPQFPQSYWLREDVPTFPTLEKDLDRDIVIVGGGITGLMAAYLLADQGLKIAVLERRRVMEGTTGHTTAKITAQHGLIYDELISSIGEEKAQLYYQSNDEALSQMKKIIQDLAIDCDYKEQEAILYATTDEYAEKLEKEAEAYEKLGIPGRLTKSIPLDVPIKNALVMENQAQFHPVKFLRALVEELINKGVKIYENTPAVKVEEGNHQTVITRNGARVLGSHVLIATHFPFYEDKALYSGRLDIERSYSIMTEPEKPYPGGMYLQVDKSGHSLRSVTIGGKEMVLIGGMGHKAGKETDTNKPYEELAKFGKDVFNASEIPYRWSAQDLITLDFVPYIGELTPNNRHVFVATGFRKWGMTNSFIAASLFYDFVVGEENRYAELYTPTRLHAKTSLPSFAKIQGKVVKSFVKGKLEKPDKTVESLGVDEGGIVTVDGKRKGAYRDRYGDLYMVDTTCTHAGCEVNWNDGERTWDCPCHGSRFNYTGEVIEGPAKKPLKK